MEQLNFPGSSPCPRCGASAVIVQNNQGTCPECQLVIQPRSLFDVYPNLAISGTFGILTLLGAIGTVAIHPGLTIFILVVGCPFLIHSFRRIFKLQNDGRRLTPFEMLFLGVSGLGTFVSLLLILAVGAFLLFWIGCMVLMIAFSKPTGGEAFLALLCPMFLGSFFVLMIWGTWKKK